MNRRLSLKFGSNQNPMSSYSIEHFSSQKTLGNSHSTPYTQKTACESGQLPSSISLQEETMPTQQLGKMSLEQSATTLESERLLQADFIKEESLMDVEEETQKMSLKARSNFKTKTQVCNVKLALGEQILNEASFRESLKDLIMGDFE